MNDFDRQPFWFSETPPLGFPPSEPFLFISLLLSLMRQFLPETLHSCFALMRTRLFNPLNFEYRKLDHSKYLAYREVRDRDPISSTGVTSFKRNGEISLKDLKRTYAIGILRENAAAPIWCIDREEDLEFLNNLCPSTTSSPVDFLNSLKPRLWVS